MNEIEEQQPQRPYKAPELMVYGKFAEVTAAGNSGGSECGNRGKKKVCRP